MDYYWDDEGNLLAQDHPQAGTGASYFWDFDHRLKKVLRAGAVVEHEYDPDGVRVRTTTTADGETRVVDYLVDTSGPLSHVVAQSDAAGTLTALYVRGDDLLAVVRPGNPVAFQLPEDRALTPAEMRAIYD